MSARVHKMREPCKIQSSLERNQQSEPTESPGSGRCVFSSKFVLVCSKCLGALRANGPAAKRNGAKCFLGGNRWALLVTGGADKAERKEAQGAWVEVKPCPRHDWQTSNEENIRGRN